MKLALYPTRIYYCRKHGEQESYFTITHNNETHRYCMACFIEHMDSVCEKLRENPTDGETDGSQ